MGKKNRLRGAFVRTCAGCGKSFDKREHDFIRIVNYNGTARTDISGKAAGRGAYVCRNAECVARVGKSGRLSKLLRCRVPSDVYKSAEELLD